MNSLAAVRSRMVLIGGPVRYIRVGLVPPRDPSRARAAREHFQKGAWAARLHDVVELIGLARMFTLLRLEDIHLPAAWRQGSGVLATRAEQDQFRGVAKLKAHAPPVGASILADFVPDEVGFVLKPPSLHHCEPFGQ